MLTVKQIMTPKVFTLKQSNSMKNAHDITHAKGIRHMPVMHSETGELVGLVTQKVMISKVLQIISEHGAENLVEQEMRTNVMDIAQTDFDVINQNRSVKDAAEFFLTNKYGCLPVVDDEGALVGVLTSSDFVRLSLTLLND